MPERGANSRSGWVLIAVAAVATLPALLFRLEILSTSIELETVFFGVAILGAAFLLSWGAEVAQLDISQALAIAFLAFIAVLPEYAVDLTFAWKAGRQDAAGEALARLCGQEHCRQLAIANMTGANRLLIGLGWATVVLVWGWRSKQRGVTLEPSHKMELGFLMLATAWAFTIPLRGSLSMIDLGVLGVLFVAYVWRAAHAPSEEPELIGPPVVIAALPTRQRRTFTILLFVFAAGMILAAAEPFADGLVHTGEKLGISSFLLVQWLAPLASEAPEMIIAVLFVLRARPSAGLGTLVSSKVNQWTLLIATIPLVYTVSRGGIHSMALDGRQVEEVLLTAAQSAFAVAVLANLTLSRAEAIMLLVLFGTQFAFESTTIRYGFSAVYVLLTIAILVKSPENRRGVTSAAREAFRLPFRR